MNSRILYTLIFLLGQTAFVHARNIPKPKSGKATTASPKSISAACAPGSGRTDLDLNNVRATIFTSGDMWWDLNNNPKYEIPKGTGKHSMFAGSLWIGGLDNGGNLKAAAMTYRSGGNDFWPGPLTVEGASTESAVCLAYDKHFKITRQEVEEFYLGSAATEAISTWPGNGIDDGAFPGYASEIAPFVDGNSNGYYEPDLRDDNGFATEYPAYDITGDLGCQARVFGDQTLWWVFNDNGNIHGETGGFPLGLEIRAQAFAFASNNALNNMTFYNYEIINRSTFSVNETYFGVWSDPDLGSYADDYAGCDVGRGLGYVYNGDEDDGGQFGYGQNPPAVGVDFFEGPFADPNNIDDSGDPCINARAINGLGYGDSIVDNERIGMARFIYYTSTGPSYANDPDNGQHIYNYLRGIWKDGTPMIYGGNGYGAGTNYSYMFPGNSDPRGYGYMITGASQTCVPEDQPLGNWSIDQFGSVPPSDFRILQSAGPFTLQSGGFNKITMGVVWGRASSGGRLASVEVVRRVDDDAQALFDNCFSIINGPDAPQTKVVELDKELILLFENTDNAKVEYYEDQTSIPGFGDVKYSFQGYQIYQLKDLSVTVPDLKDVNRARLVAQVDLKDSITQVINRTFDLDLNESIPTLEANGENQGLKNSFKVTTDLFAVGDNRLVNHRKYYYMVLSYATADIINNTEFGQSYLAGRRTFGTSSIQIYTGIPHINSPQFGGTDIQAAYGDQPSLTRTEGWGNGGNFVDLSDQSVTEILSEPFWAKNPVYNRNAGPVNIKVIDPLSVPEGNFEFRVNTLDSLAESAWTMTYLDAQSGQLSEYTSKHSISKGVEEVIAEWGLSATFRQVVEPGVNPLSGNGFIDGSQEFADNSRRWLTFLTDQEGCENAANWIRSGTLENTGTGADVTCNDVLGLDERSIFEKVIGGTWAPYMLVSRYNDGPAYNTSATTQIQGNLKRISSVDIVFTSDQSKWTRCPVFETGDDADFAEGNAEKGNLREAPSVDKNGNPDGDGKGLSWFPGYAINVETGERLNIGFGESSRLAQDNGRDMKFNPSSRSIIFNQSTGELLNVLGGKHFIYVFNHSGSTVNDMPRYDKGAFIHTKLSDPTAANKRAVYKDAAWVAVPLGVDNQEFLSNELKIRIRVNRPYTKFYNPSDSTETAVNGNRPLYSFNTGDLYAKRNQGETAKSALDLINVVPNPYYAYSGYEKNQLDNRVKVTNLPQDCKIRIYTTSGILVRTYNKADPSTSLDWDLKNQAGITISSGIYIIHVEVPGVGEKVVKFFGVLRPIDLDTF